MYRSFRIVIRVWLVFSFGFTFSALGQSGCSTVVTSTNDSGPGTLRDAIQCANSIPGVDTITFNIPGSGVQTITPLTVLPDITDPVIIDGYSQPGASPNTLSNADNAVVLIELNDGIVGWPGRAAGHRG
jgi:hypothetical protein